jgi:uncharacterized protein YecT (DUF1311 family)
MITLEFINGVQFWKTAIIFAIATGILTHTPEAVADVSDTSRWNVQQQQDKFTGKSHIEAEKQFSTEAHDQIQVAVKCYRDSLNGNNPSDFDPALGVVFSFNLFDSNGQPTKVFTRKTGITATDSYYSSAGGFHSEQRQGQAYVAVQYRLDNGSIKNQASSTDFKNVAELQFSSIMAQNAGMSPETLFLGYDSPKVLVKAKLLKVRLPIKGEEPADMEIQLSDLQPFFAACPTTQALMSAITQQDSVSAGQTKNRESTQPTDVLTTTESKMPEQTIAPSDTSAIKNIPTLKCSGPKKRILDTLMCADPELVKADGETNGAYVALSQKSDALTTKVNANEQKYWLANRAQNCGLKPFVSINEQESARLIQCLKELYGQRLKELKGQLQ